MGENKTVCMLLKGVLSDRREVSLHVNGMRIKYAKCVKYLGISMSERFGTKPHLVDIRKKFVNTVGWIRRMIWKEWGLRKKAECAICKGLWVACALYGASTWGSVCNYEYGRKRLNACQRVVLYACLNLCRTVSTEAMQVLLAEPPWDFLCEKTCALYGVKKGVCIDVCDRSANGGWSANVTWEWT